MSEEKEDFGTPERPDRPRRDGQGDRGNRSESSREERPNRYGVPRDGKPRQQRDSRPPRSDRPQRSDRPSYGDRPQRSDRAPYGDRPQRGDRPSYGDRPQRSDRPSYGDRARSTDRDSRSDRPQRSERPSYGDRPQRSDRPRYGDRPDRPRSSERDSSRSERPYRPSSDRPTYGDRGDRNGRPERGGYARGGSSGSPRGERPGSDRGGKPPYGDRPQRSDRPYRPSSDRPYSSDRLQRNDRYERSERPQRSGGYDRNSRPERSDRPSYRDNDRSSSGYSRGPRDRDERPRFEERELTEQELLARKLRRVRPDHIDPEIDDDVTDDMLDKGARNELKTLTKENAEVVAKHLVMATRLLDSDPERAHQHVISASRKAGRIAIVRETLGITAYATGDFALALRELRTFRRISGSNEQIALMVDSERGVGRPDRALELGRSVDRSTLSEGTQVALAVAMSGARLDQDQVELALAELEIPQLDPSKAFSYSPALFYAYAEVLEEMGRHQEAAEWTSCAEIAEQALAEAQGPADDGSEDDMIVIEEGVDEQSEELVADSDDLSDVLEDDVRQVLEETAHLDVEDKA